MSVQIVYCPPFLEGTASSSSSSSSSSHSSSSSSTSTSSSTPTSSDSSSSTSPSPSSQFAPITRPGAILEISGALLRSAKKRQISRQDIEVSKSVENFEYTLRLSRIAYASMCLEGQVPMPSANMQHPTVQLHIEPALALTWNPLKDPFFSLITTIEEFRESNLSPQERLVATPGEIRKAIHGKLPEMRGIWTDIILNNFQREPKEMVVELTEEERNESSEEKVAPPPKPIVYDGPPNMTSAFDESDDEGDDKAESKVKVAQVAQKVVAMVAEIQKVVEIEMVDVKKGDVKEIEIKPMPMSTLQKTATPSRLPKRKSQWTELQTRLQRATEKMKQLVSCNGGDHFESSGDDGVNTQKVSELPSSSARTVCRPPPSLKIVGRAPPPRPNWTHCSMFDEACLEQFLNCNCASSLEKCPGCIPSAVRVAVDEDLI